MNDQKALQLGVIISHDEKLLNIHLLKGDTTQSKGVMKNLPFTIQNKRMKQDFHLFLILGYDVILGKPWLHDYNLDINWKTHRMTFQREEVTKKIQLSKIEHITAQQLNRMIKKEEDC